MCENSLRRESSLAHDRHILFHLIAADHPSLRPVLGHEYPSCCKLSYTSHTVQTEIQLCNWDIADILPKGAWAARGFNLAQCVKGGHSSHCTTLPHYTPWYCTLRVYHFHDGVCLVDYGNCLQHMEWMRHMGVTWPARRCTLCSLCGWLVILWGYSRGYHTPVLHMAQVFLCFAG